MRNDNNWKMIASSNKTRVDSIARQLFAMRNAGPLPIDPDSTVAKSLGCTMVMLVGVFVECSGGDLLTQLTFALPHEIDSDPKQRRCVTVPLSDNPIL